MRQLANVLVALIVVGCAGQAVATGTSMTPDAAFSCVSTMVTSMGFTITSSEPAKGAITAERLAPGSQPSEIGLKYFTIIEVAIYADRDGQTRLMAKPGRMKQDGQAPRTGAGVTVLDVDDAPADSLARACRGR